MKLKVTYRTYGKRTASFVVEVSAGSIADTLKEEAYNEIRKNVIAGKKEVISYGYIQNIEDID